MLVDAITIGALLGIVIILGYCHATTLKRLDKIQETFDGLKRTNEEYISKQFPDIPPEAFEEEEDYLAERAKSSHNDRIAMMVEDLYGETEWPQIEELKERVQRRF
jgi:hypothetical protein